MHSISASARHRIRAEWATSYVVNVAAGEQKLALVDASAFITNELVVVQGTNTPLPFSVTIE